MDPGRDLSDVLVNETTQRIVEEHRTRQRFVSLNPSRAGDLQFAYSVQERLVQRYQDAGDGPIIGWKVGLTSARMQAMVGLSEPIAGAILEGWRRQSGAILEMRDFMHLGIEAELAVRMGDTIAQVEPLEPVDLMQRIASLAAAFEIIDDRNADYKNLDAASLIADNSWNKGIVLGPPSPGQAFSSLRGRRCVLSVNGHVVDEGMSEDAGGDPLRIVAWLAAHLAARGTPLERDQWVMTGSIVTTKFPTPGDRYDFSIEGLATVAVVVEHEQPVR